MIDFRYFLVSIAAIFLALAVGVALGAGPLKGQFDSQLRDQVDALGKERESLRSELGQLQHIDKYRDDVATEIAPALVDGKLSGRRVVVVSLPGADGEVVKGIRELVKASDAEVTGTVQVTDKWSDPAQRQFLDDLATQLVTGDVKIPEQGTAYDRVGALLARAVVSKDALTAPDTAAQRIMSAFGEGDLVKADSGLPRADLAVVVAPPVPAPKPDEPQSAEAQDQARATSAAWVALTRALDEAGSGAVLAGDQSSAGDLGAVGVLRADAQASAAVSSIDVADLPSGRLGAVWALAEQATGKSGQYGAGKDADDGILPKLTTP